MTTPTVEVPAPFDVAAVRIIDWYDAPVTAVVEERSTGPWLGVLLARQRSRIRIYGLVPTTVATAEELGRLLDRPASQTGWSGPSKRFHVALSESDGPLVLLRGEILAPAESFEQTVLPWDTYRGRVTFAADEAYSKERVLTWSMTFDDALEDE